MRNFGLGGQIVLTMTCAVLVVVLVCVIGFYAFYALLDVSGSGLVFSEAWWPYGLEWSWILIATMLAVWISVTVARRLARRILEPLVSVAHSLRQLTDGDLSVRASYGANPMGETMVLVNDFNVMAERLEAMSKDRVFWNAAIAHELRTPITILRGRIQGLAEGVFETNVTQLNSLLNQIDGLNRIVEDLRVLSLADSGHLALHCASVDVADTARIACDFFAPALADCGFRVSMDLTSSVAVCDPHRIRQALFAVLDNARRHATPGNLHLSCQVVGRVCMIILADEGPGVSANAAGTLFEAFRRGDPSRSRQGGGTGLGLAVVRSIMHAHGGNASFQANDMGGTSFQLSWPTTRDTEQATIRSH